MVWMGLVGFNEDYLKVVKKQYFYFNNICIPVIKCLFNKKNKHIVGSEVRMTVLIIQGIVPPDLPLMLATATITGLTSGLIESTNPNKRSFHMNVIWNNATIAIGAQEIGKKI